MDANTPLGLARSRLEHEVRSAGGTDAQPVCPCCGRNAGRDFNLSRMHALELARFLHAVSGRILELEQDGRLPNPGSNSFIKVDIHVPTELGLGAESYSQNCISHLKQYGFITNRSMSGSRLERGRWRMTSAGRAWLLGVGPDARVPKHLWIFRDEVVWASKEKVSAEDLAPAPVLKEAMRTGRIPR